MSASIQRSDNLVPGRKVYIVGAAYEYANWQQAEIVDRMADASYVLFVGGEDVMPSLYGAVAHPSTYCNPMRDVYEKNVFQKARDMRLPMVGICRGCQFGTVMSGGRLVQDQQNPSYLHPIETIDGKRIIVSSTHHQASHPWNLPREDYDVIGWSVGQSPHHWGEHDGDELVIGKVPGNKEVEIVHFKKTRFLGIQSHPEGVYPDYDRYPKARESIDYMRGLLDRFLAGTL